MLSLKYKLKTTLLSCYNFFRNKTEGTEKQILWFGVILSINYPLYHFLFRYTSSDSYENLALRLAASIICTPLIFVHYWPKKYLKILPIYWYFAITFCLPFFFTFMTIMNQWSMIWILNYLLSVLLIFILIDFTGLCITLSIGSISAFIYSSLYLETPFKFNPGSVDLISTIGVTVAALVIGGVFAKNRDRIIAEKIQKKSEAANKAKNEFISNMSHDIRTPITGIIGLSQELRDKAFSIEKELSEYTNLHTAKQGILEFSDLVKKDSLLMTNATNELLQLCNEILETINLKNIVKNQNSELINIRDLVQQILELFYPVAKNKKLDLSVTIEQNIPQNIYGNKKYIYTCILNLVSNALKFTLSGYVKIQVSSTKANLSTNYLDIIIEDSGVGIPNDKFEIIFENFSRLTPSFEGIYKGYGLGLHTVKKYVEFMHGTINLESEVNKGTKFILSIPYSIADYSNYEPKSIKPHMITSTQKQEAPQNDKKTILIVEDNMLAAKAIEVILKPYKYQIKKASSGLEAIKMITEYDFNLILMDIGLPGMCGIETTKLIRSLQETKASVPIIALTGHVNNKDIIDQALNAGMQEIMIKPAQPKILDALLKKYIL